MKFFYISKRYFCCFIIICLCLSNACKNKSDTVTAFYYWKARFNLNAAQRTVLQQTAGNKLYIRFFDIIWDNINRKAYPNAIISFKQPVTLYHITPVIYITNKTLESIDAGSIDSLAINSNKLINSIASLNKINYQDVQFDCDWTISTKEKYFSFLRAFKKLNQHALEATIRLHQIKYKIATGIPPVDKGVLMFYNMGKPNIGLGERNSIYNEADAAKYISYLTAYPLKLDIALPLFSWALQIRNHQIIQVYEKIKRPQLNNAIYFKRDDYSYTAKRSFFLDGVYIKESDIFKLEEIDINTLQKAAKQLTASLPKQNNRTVIYYELANINPAEFNAEKLREVSADF